MKKKVISMVLSFCLLMTTPFIGGCQQNQQPTDSNNTTLGQTQSTTVANTNTVKKKIGYILLYRRDEWYKTVEQVAKDTAAKRGLDIIVQDSDYDSSKQVQQMESLIIQKLDAIALAPTDPSGPLTAIKSAKDKGIPVFAYDTGLDSYNDVVSYVGFDNYKAGYDMGVLAAKFLNDNYGGKGKVGIIYNPQNAFVHGERVRGFKASLMEKCPGAQIIAEQDGKDDRGTSMTVMENILTANKDVAVMFGGNPDTQYGIIAAMDSKGIDPSKVFVCGEGWGEETLKWLTSDKPYMKACFVTPPDKQAADTINVIADYLEGKTVQPKSMIDADVVTKDGAIEYFKKYGIELK